MGLCLRSNDAEKIRELQGILTACTMHNNAFCKGVKKETVFLLSCVLTGEKCVEEFGKACKRLSAADECAFDRGTFSRQS